MPDVHVRIEIREGTGINQAIRSMQRTDPDFPSLEGGQEWWHKPPDNARALLARRLSRYGLSGRLSVAVHQEGTEWDAKPPPVWSGFTAKRTKR